MCRFCPVDDRCDIPLDCTDEQTIRRLIDATKEYIKANSSRFDRVCQLLLKGGDEQAVVRTLFAISPAGIHITSFTDCSSYLLVVLFAMFVIICSRCDQPTTTCASP